MAKFCILVLSGLPGSGKTHVASLLSSWLEQTNNTFSQTSKLPQDGSVSTHGVSCCHVCYDELMQKDVEKSLIGLTCSQVPSKWKEYRKNIMQCVDIAIQCSAKQPIDEEYISSSDIPQALLERFNALVRITNLPVQSHLVLLIDDNMYYRSMRYEYYQLCRKHNISFAQLHLTCSIETAKARNRERLNQVDENVIEDMAAKIEPPSLENKWEKYTLTWNTDNKEQHNFQEMLSVIKMSLADPVVMLDAEDEISIIESQVVCSKNAIHQADQIMRKLTSEHMVSFKAKLPNCSKEEMKAMAQMHNKVKTEIMERMKCGSLKIPQELERHSADSSKDHHNPMFKFVQLVFDTSISKNSQQNVEKE